MKSHVSCRSRLSYSLSVYLWGTFAVLLLGSGRLGTADELESMQSDLVIADFEGETYGDWQTTGNAFGEGPAHGTLLGQMPVDGYVGRGLVNTFLGGDQSTGTLTSPEFTIERDYISFLIGGGRDEDKLALQLWIDGKVVRNATGPNDQSGGSERLSLEWWDVTEFKGQLAMIRIVDMATGGWGHINVDQIVQTNAQPSGSIANAEVSTIASKRYLHFPIRNGASRRAVTIVVDGKSIVRNDIELADQESEIDWWAPMEIDRWKGALLTVRVDKLPSNSNGLELLRQADEIIGVENIYQEPLRGQFHFSSRRGWLNDPNGMVYYNGEYHLFYQHNPYGWSWGNMHWGHAVSEDMVHWKELGDKLWPDEMGPMFSGSGVVDWKNTSEFGESSQPPMVLTYTAAGDPTVQCIAFSHDGRKVIKFDGNPILPQVTPGNRDPKVLWHQPTSRWVMVLYVELNKKHTIHFYTSPDLREWELASVLEGDDLSGRYLFECPDLFPLCIDGNQENSKWVLLAADGQYAVGSFDGRVFTPEHERLSGPVGRGFYAAQSFSDIPASDGRRILIGWWQTETKGMPFNQSMTMPLELGLTNTTEGPRLTFQPIRELAVLRSKSHHFDGLLVREGDRNPLDAIRSELIEIRSEFELGEASEIIFNVRDVMVVYFPKRQELRVDDQIVNAPSMDGKIDLMIFCDRTGVEVFASRGRCYVPLPFNTDPENQRIFLEIRGGQATATHLEIHQLRPAWRTE